MDITILVENTSVCENVACVHGLSLYIETDKHRILFDAGPDGELLLKNAEALGIDLRKVDIAIVSHGHFDHAGGMLTFLEHNSEAKLYMHRLAAKGHFATEDIGYRNIGVAPEIFEKYSDRIIFNDDCLEIDEELMLFSDIKTADYLSGANKTLFEETDEGHIIDRFYHEQNLIIKHKDEYVLVAGCAHRGIVNILRRAQEHMGKAPSHTFSGMHLTNPGLKIDEPEEHVRNVGKALNDIPGKYHTGHCTGMGPYSILQTILSDRLSYIAGGTRFTV